MRSHAVRTASHRVSEPLDGFSALHLLPPAVRAGGAPRLPALPPAALAEMAP
jgi:hypothetical protein